MKFLLIVLVVRFLIELMTSKRNKTTTKEINKVDKIVHPAEHEVREDYFFRVFGW